MKFTASLVAYRTPEATVGRLRESVMSEGAADFIVVDNTVDNVGFGAGHNKAIRRAVAEGSEFHFIVNPDIFFEPGTLKSIIGFMSSHPGVGMVMPKTVGVNGEFLYNCKLLPTPMDLIGRRFLPGFLASRRNWRFEMRWSGYGREDRTMEVPYLCGCFLCFRTEALRAVGLFDERFFMYPEDIDITRRMWSAGWHPTYFPGAQVVHAHERASYRSMGMLRVHCANMVRYFNKWGWFFDGERSRINAEATRRICGGRPSGCKRR